MDRNTTAKSQREFQIVGAATAKLQKPKQITTT